MSFFTLQQSAPLQDEAPLQQEGAHFTVASSQLPQIEEQPVPNKATAAVTKAKPNFDVLFMMLTPKKLINFSINIIVTKVDPVNQPASQK